MLDLKENGVTISTVQEGGWVRLPDGSVFSPAYDGWSSGAYSLAPTPFVPDAPPTLEEERAAMKVSRLQARVALLQAGLLPQVEAAVAAADPIIQMAWANAIEFRRFSPTILALSAQIGLTDTQLDNLFRAAALVDL